MNLHKNYKEFYDTLLVTADWLNTLSNIIEKIYYKDYKEIIQKVLFDETNYETAITALETIIASGVFETEN